MTDLRGYDWYSDWETLRAETAKPLQTPGDVRTPFERDWARIIHSVAFRRLQGKTQIFAPGAADFMRTRVTHSIEVAQIGRALAKRFGMPESLVEAACLAHDLGHPPFGHTGEGALNDLMADYGGFEGNAQSFRIVTRLELKSPDFAGLDLCRATLHGLIKYPYRREAGYKKYLYEDDADKLERFLYDGIKKSLLSKFDPEALPQRTLPCQLMDWSDDIAYSVHDLEDGIASGLLIPATWKSDKFVESIWAGIQNADGIRWADRPPDQETVRSIIADLTDRIAYSAAPVIPRDVIRETTRYYIDRFATQGDVEASGTGETLYDYTLVLPEEVRIENQVLKQITMEYVIWDVRTTTFVFKGREILTRLFETLLPDAGKEARLFPREQRDELKSLHGNEAALARHVCDYLASMTEGQAIQLYGRLFEPEAGSPFVSL